MNVLKRISICILSLCCILHAKAITYSFESTVPTEWSSVVNGTLSISDARYKLQAKSLRWNWNAESVITVVNPDNLAASTATVSKATAAGIDGWIYNENPSTERLFFEFYNQSGVRKCSLEFKLNFRGWRRVCVRFYEDLGYDRSPLQSMKVVAPAVGSGIIYFDCFEFSSSVTWERISDFQYDVQANKNNPDVDNFLKFRNIPKLPLPESVSDAERVSYDTIIKRVENWHLGTDKYATNPYYSARSNALNRTSGSGSTFVSRGRRKMVDFPLTRGEDGIVTNKGLFCLRQTSIDAIPVENFKTYSEQYLLQLAYDWRLNGSTDSRDYVLKMYDWYNNQGWADGSAIGVLRYDRLRNCGYFHSLFLMRDALVAEIYEREMQTMYWYSMFGSCYGKPDIVGETADNVRGVAMSKLIYALMQTGDRERVRALRAFSEYMNNALSTSPGYFGIFKSDHSGYHHRGPYANAYVPDALHIGCLIYYLLHNTSYQLSNEVYENLKAALIDYYDFICSGYQVPQSLTGRFPNNPEILHELLPAIAFLSLSNEQVDKDLVSMLKRLWKPEEEPVKSWLPYINIDNTFKTTLGAIEVILEALNNNISEAPLQQGNKFFPYAGLLASKYEAWQLNIKGMSSYVWDFESSSTENLYGRYISNGTVQILNQDRNINSHEVSNVDWDWSRIPGATAKYLTKSEIAFDGTKHRNFSDKIFLAGVSVNDSIGFFSMQFHDNTFDKSFYANKSVFVFGKNSYHIGSNIRSTSTSGNVETTLFQSLANAGVAKLNGLNISSSINASAPATLQDNYGNTFIVKKGNINIFQNPTFTSGVINHGVQPKNDSYQYLLLLDASADDILRMENQTTQPIQLVKADDTAHIIHHKDYGVTGYALFQAGKVDYEIIDSVNTPCIILVRHSVDSLYYISFSDPDMRKKTAARNNDLSYEDAAVPSDSFDIEIFLNQPFVKNSTNDVVDIEMVDGRSVIKSRVAEGHSYQIILKKKSNTTNVKSSIDSEVEFYPNPVSDWLHIKGLPSKVTLRIYNIEGRLLRTMDVQSSDVTVDTSALPKGIYFLLITKDDENIVSKQILKL